MAGDESSRPSRQPHSAPLAENTVAIPTVDAFTQFRGWLQLTGSYRYTVTVVPGP